MNSIYGFQGEIQHKYDDKVMDTFAKVFKWLPLAAVIQDKVRSFALPPSPNLMLLLFGSWLLLDLRGARWPEHAGGRDPGPDRGHPAQQGAAADRPDVRPALGRSPSAIFVYC